MQSQWFVCVSRYKLESALQDCVRGVRVRRRVLAPHAVNPSALDTLPYEHYDYSKASAAVQVAIANVTLLKAEHYISDFL